MPVIAVLRFRLPRRGFTPASAILAVAALGAAGVGLATPALAVGETLTVALSQTTGTGPFDADDAAGHDASAANTVVRTNDTVTYTVALNTSGGGDQSAPTIAFTLPQGEELVSLPPFCLAGSSVTPPTLPPPAVPVTPTSYLALPAQAVTCVVATQSVNTSLDYQFISKVRPEVPNATTLGPVTASATSTQVTAPSTSNPVSHTASAAPSFDLSKRLNGTTDNTGPYFSFYNACSFDPARACRFAEYPLTLSAPTGGKGISPLASPITFTDDLSPDVFYPASTTSSAAWLAAGAGAADKYGARLTVCNSGSLNLHGFIANPSGGNGTTNIRAVRSNGTITCTQPGGPGTPVLFTITDADTTAFTTPTQNTDGGALPGDVALVVSTAIRVEIPVDAVNDLGVFANNSYTLDTRNTFTNIVAADIAGTPNVDNPANNVRDAVQRLDIGDGTLSKAFVGVTGQPGNASPAGYGGVWEGLPGGSFYRDGNTVVVKGQTVISALTSERHNIPPLSGTTYSNSTIVCDTWDDTKLGLPQTFNYPGSSSTRLSAPSNGSAAWMASWQDGSVTSIDPATVANLRFQYSYTPTPSQGAGSACDGGAWFDSPGAVPGATVVDGAYQGVNRVRISFTDKAAPASDFYIINFAIAMTVVSDDATGTILPNYASQISTSGVQGMDAILADPARRAYLSTYNAATTGGQQGDRLILGDASVRIAKDIRNPANGQFSDSAIPQYTAGSTVDYRLRPTLTSVVNAGLSADVSIEDCLPKYQAFVSSVRESGAAITPAVVQDGAPAGAELACPAGQTYIRWDFGPTPIGQTIDPIIYTVEELATVRNGNYINTAVVSSPADASPVAARTDTAQIQIVVPTGIKIAKSVDKPLIEVNPLGVADPRSFTWTVDFANIDSPLNVSDADVIDVLPADGQNGSDFTGSLAFDSVTAAPGTTGVTTLYTKAAPASLSTDPGAASNLGAGSTVWCSARSGGVVVLGSGTAADCPSSAAQVTGLRFQRPGAFTPTDQFTMKIAMTPVGNAAADVYENRAGARVVGVTLQVGPAIRQVEVVASSIGDLVWEDINANGLQDEGEPGIAGFPVSLSGADVDGNAVTRSTTTDASGRYLFDGLASGTYTVTFSPTGLAAGRTFTTRDVDGDASDQIDSDGDAATGVTAPIVLGSDTENLSVDQGITAILSSLSLSKTIVDPNPYDLAGDATTFPATVSCMGPTGYPAVTRNVTVATDGPTLVEGLYAGSSCTIAETDTDGGIATYVPSSTVPVAAGQTATVAITNTYPAPVLGTITLSKAIVDLNPYDTAGDAATFPVTVGCTGPEGYPGIERSVDLPRDGSAVPVDGLYVGSSCTVVETDTDGGTVTYSTDGPVTVIFNETISVVVTNTYPGPLLGSIVLTKTIVDPNPADTKGDAASYPVTVTCTGPVGYPGTVRTIVLPRTGAPVTVDGLYQGATCAIVETDTDGGTAAYSPSGAITVAAAPVTVIVTNTFPEAAQLAAPPKGPLATTGTQDAQVLRLGLAALAMGLLMVVGARRVRR